jgi:hypothetical protein
VAKGGLKAPVYAAAPVAKLGMMFMYDHHTGLHVSLAERYWQLREKERSRERHVVCDHGACELHFGDLLKYVCYVRGDDCTFLDLSSPLARA